MKSQKFNKKLNLNKLTIASLDEIKGGKDAQPAPSVIICPTPTYWTCYQYTCDGWTRCPDLAC